MTATITWKAVPKQEYDEFIKNYPAKLEFNWAKMYEPPLGSYNDFSDGKVWPESMVAKEMALYLGPNGETDNSVPGKFWEYYIKIA